ncbi:hypothetical protein AMJ40_01135 [candidate division TA06 bacterium DG_26]|uniref:DUF2905 domain-containing protein n=1 Tax=candidate division TA06 bacterium DG_26 TaxID=1703771 RepID=A0A0S7WLI8_UNCT6|nr:MAG: hypothetical protein AMJ40_01135 [candidate division TA06 bacterium DG_26]
MHPLGKMLIVAGILLVGVGVLLVAFHKIPFLGKLPGDITIHRKNLFIFFPITTALIISFVLTILFNLWFRK